MLDPSAQTSVDIRAVTKTFGSFTAVDDVSLSIAAGEFFSLLGPSGCGKTTLLRMIGGFEMPTGGEVFVSGRNVTHLPPYRRPVNLVFQHYALFPHLSAARNVAFGLRYQPHSRRQLAAKIAGALEMVRLGGLGDRYPHELSGGQRQRVALARALVLEPAVLLLDEPLGALDQKLRKEMQVELKGLQRELGITFIFVTHDQEEALTMSDRIAVMNAGRVEQVGAAAAVFESPATPFVANFMGATNVLSPSLRDAHGFPLPLEPGGSFVIRPEKLRLESGAAPIGDEFVSLPVQIQQRIYQGLMTLWTVRTQSGDVLTVYEQNIDRVEAASGASDSGQGQPRFVWFKPCHVIALGNSAVRPEAAYAV